MSGYEPICAQSGDEEYVHRSVPSRTSCGAIGLPDWVHAPADKVDQPKPALLAVDTLMTVDDVAAYLRVSTKTVRRQIAAGHISAIRIGRLIRVSPEELMRLTGIKYNSVISNKEKYRE